MKKGFTALVASAVMCSVAFASPTANEPSFTGLNATEHAALFGEGSTAQAVALDGAEMKNTQGELVPAVAWAIGVTYLTYANAPSWQRTRLQSKWPVENYFIGVHYTR